MRVDSHQHFWQIARGDYGWTQGKEVLHRDYLPLDLKTHLQESKIDKTIVVQAAPTLQDTEFMLGLAKDNESIAGVVGWMDLERSDYREQYRHLLAQPGLVGIRVMIQSMKNADDVLRPASLEALQFLADENFSVDLLMHAGQLSSVQQLLREVPTLRGVIDHIAKPDIAKGQWEPWASQLQELASYPGIYCKLSGMVTEADHNGWAVEDFIPYVRHMVEAFGTNRVMFGSDWPVCLLAASYGQVVKILEAALPEGLTEAESAAIFGHNALHFYKLEHLIQ
ncbi:amidohydrolase family protein [Paenibacillus agricola]|uniref:Amidohydrolase family protein n=1 Tax=Paenibacillus agricola TaxID=2716264 RepID=A0ABX0JC32_9BACL|nr:amidohydrolase family protein [Paenibacillus agricola]NHN33989.1 amidohydrolase family protein [Paenibacillus agricola]